MTHGRAGTEAENERTRQRQDERRKEGPPTDPHGGGELEMLEAGLCQGWITKEGRVDMRIRADRIRAALPDHIRAKMDQHEETQE